MVLCYGFLRGVVMSWVLKGCGFCHGYLRGVIMFWVFKECDYVIGI